MIPAAATHVAAPVFVFTTDGGTHSPEHWAIVTARMLVSTGQNLSPARLEAARTLREKMVATLTDAFQSVKPTTSIEDIETIAQNAVVGILEHSKVTPWEMEFGHQDIQGMMLDVVRRNLATHADIGLRTE